MRHKFDNLFGHVQCNDGKTAKYNVGYMPKTIGALLERPKWQFCYGFTGGESLRPPKITAHTSSILFFEKVEK